jgi:hypothetical protein
MTLAGNISAAQWGKPPKDWNDFKMGLVNRVRTEPWDSNLVKAVGLGIQVDYRYAYITTVGDITGSFFAPWYNYAKQCPKGVAPSITIYMINQGNDNIQAIMNSGSNSTFMKSFFAGIITIADSCKGFKPIYIIEPDAWGYMLQGDISGLGGKYLSQTCNINNLGYSWLSGFSNTFADLPGAIIKTLKQRDSTCYAGILMAHWGLNSFWLPSPEENANKTVPFLKKILKAPNTGDFLSIEKYGADAGSSDKVTWMWDDTKNANFVTWCKTLAKGIDLPLCGWQTSIGYENGKEPGYPDLPNSSMKYEDTFFPYFFRHTTDFINAGFIGFLAGCANQNQGTVYSLKKGEGDNGYFFDKLKVFNTARPYNLNLSTGIASKNGLLPAGSQRLKVHTTSVGNAVLFSGTFPSYTPASIRLMSPSGRMIATLYSGTPVGEYWHTPLTGLAGGVYIVEALVNNKRFTQRIAIGQ